MAQGRSNAAIADALVITGRVVEEHVPNIFARINLPDTRLGQTAVSSRSSPGSKAL
jgi:DNA-binding NarL/FixJ family response regulator